MKKLITFTFLIFALASQAQKLKDKLEKASGSKESTTTSSAIPLTANQYEMVEPFSTATKVWFTGLKNGISDGPVYFEPTNFLREFERDEKNVVKSFNSDATMSPDFPEFPKSFLSYRKDRQIFFIQGYCFILNVYEGVFKTPEDIDKIQNEAVFERILCLGKEEAKSITFDKSKEIIKTYLTEVQKGVDAINAKKDEAAAELRAKYSIKDKKVKSIVLETESEFIRYKESVNYAIVATLEDGTVIKAGNGGTGFMDDYTIEVTGMVGSDGKSLYNGFYATPTDKITLKVTSKYHPEKTATKIFKMKYEIVEFTGPGLFKFENRSAEPPYNGINTRIEIKQVKNSNTSETMLEYRIYDMGATKPHYAFRCTPDTPVEVGAQGRRITSEAKGWGQTGGDGGTIKVIVDPSVTVSYNLITNVKGARGQAGEAGEGKAGSDGSVETVKQKINW